MTHNANGTAAGYDVRTETVLEDIAPEQMEEAAEDLRFEYAARLRDEIRELRRDLRDAMN